MVTPPSFEVWLNAQDNLVAQQQEFKNEIDQLNGARRAAISANKLALAKTLEQQIYLKMNEWREWTTAAKQGYNQFLWQLGIVPDEWKTTDAGYRAQSLLDKKKHVDTATAVGVGAGTFLALLMLKRGVEDSIKAIGGVVTAVYEQKQARAAQVADVIT